MKRFQREDHKGACPVCGEPSRLAVINKSGKKEMTCPRCHFAWEEKKISCAHCGTEEQGQVDCVKELKTTKVQKSMHVNHVRGILKSLILENYLK